LIAATPDQRPALERAAAQFSEEDLTRFFQILLQTDDDLRRKPDPRVHLEMGLLRLINASRLAPLEELLAEVREGAPISGAAAGRSRSTSAAPLPALTQRQPVPSQPSPVAGPARIPVSERPASAPNGGTAPFQDSQPNVDVSVEATSTQPESAAPLVSGITEEQVSEIKQAIQAQQKFLGELVEHGTRWELEGAELRIYFSPNHRAFAEMLEGREPLEKVRIASGKVLGRTVRVCAKLEAVAAAAASASRAGSATQELRAQFESDPMVKSMLQRFGGKIAEVKHRPEET
jgi:DNA polymerase III gamma/tau subunit